MSLLSRCTRPSAKFQKSSQTLSILSFRVFNMGIILISVQGFLKKGSRYMYVCNVYNIELIFAGYILEIHPPCLIKYHRAYLSVQYNCLLLLLLGSLLWWLQKTNYLLWVLTTETRNTWAWLYSSFITRSIYFFPSDFFFSRFAEKKNRGITPKVGR